MVSNHQITRSSTAPAIHIPLVPPPPPSQRHRTMPSAASPGALTLSLDMDGLRAPNTLPRHQRHHHNHNHNHNQQKQLQLQRLPLTPLDSTLARRLPVAPLSIGSGAASASSAASAAATATANVTANATDTATTADGNTMGCNDETMLARRAARTYQNGPQLIMPYLYLGSEANAANDQMLRVLGISHVLNVAREVNGPTSNNNNSIAAMMRHHQTNNGNSGSAAESAKTNPQPAANKDGREDGELCYKHYRWDHNESDLARHFNECFAFIDSARTRHQGVLVHCQLGVSRSASLVIAYVMRTMRMQFGASYEYVRLRAPCISPNLSLISQLHEYGASLAVTRERGDSSTSEDASSSSSSAAAAAAAVVSLPPPELVPPASSSSSSENASPIEDSVTGHTLCCHVLPSPLLTAKPSDRVQNPLVLKIVASRHPLVP
ncbi:tyrosine/serine/threonine protein phosphatase [Coemansia sp. RSA 1285]|nr:tyrosine/serine/threonine protein phosphatase [Coemansia sp. RSA 1285]